MRYIMIILIMGCAILTLSCSQIGTSAEINIVYERYATPSERIYRYYSSDMRNFISAKMKGIDGNSFVVELHLNDTIFLVDVFVDESWDRNTLRPLGLWLNDNQVILAGRRLYSLSDNTMKEFDFKALDEWYDPANSYNRTKFYCLSLDNTTLYYNYTANFNNVIYSYNIESKLIERIYERDFEFFDTSPNSYDIVCADNGVVYFVMHERRLYKYSLDSHGIDPTNVSCSNVKINDSGRYLACYSNDTDLTQIWDSNLLAVILEFKGKIFTFGANDLIVYLDDSKQIVEYSLTSRSITGTASNGIDNNSNQAVTEIVPDGESYIVYILDDAFDLGNSQYIEDIPEDKVVDVSVYLDSLGNQVIFDVPPYIDHDRTMIPIRAVSESLGLQVDWDGAASKATISQDNQTLTLYNEGDTATITTNGQERTESLDAPVAIKDGRMFVPLRFIAEYFGYSVEWIGETNTVLLEK